MATKDELKRLLRRAAALSRKSVSEQELSEAADLLSREKKASAEILQQIGESVAHDPGTFKASDIDEINAVLDTLRK
jgi:hypothetical protein